MNLNGKRKETKPRYTVLENLKAENIVFPKLQKIFNNINLAETADSDTEHRKYIIDPVLIMKS